MKNVKIIINGLGYKNINQSYILVYDYNDKLIYKCKSYNGIINVCLKEKCIYKLIICSLGITKYFYLSSNQSNIVIYTNYIVNNINNNIRFFTLTDKNYENLKIERGEISV